MKAPSALVAALHAYDPRLRVRWAAATRQWFIERRMPERHPDFLAELRPPVSETEGMDPEQRAGARLMADRYDSLSTGWWPAFTVPHEAIRQTDRVMLALREWDGHAHGFAAINQRLDAAQAAWEAARAKERADFVEDRLGEVYATVQWRGGHRMTTSDMAEGAEPADVIEARDGYTVRTRKRALV